MRDGTLLGSTKANFLFHVAACAEVMPILYSVVARGTTVLAKYANCAGNFSEVVELVLGKISPENAKLTYTHGR